jgi:hypothetical protein
LQCHLLSSNAAWKTSKLPGSHLNQEAVLTQFVYACPDCPPVPCPHWTVFLLIIVLFLLSFGITRVDLVLGETGTDWHTWCEAGGMVQRECRREVDT